MLVGPHAGQRLVRVRWGAGPESASCKARWRREAKVAEEVEVEVETATAAAIEVAVPRGESMRRSWFVVAVALPIARRVAPPPA